MIPRPPKQDTSVALSTETPDANRPAKQSALTDTTKNSKKRKATSGDDVNEEMPVKKKSSKPAVPGTLKKHHTASQVEKLREKSLLSNNQRAKKALRKNKNMRRASGAGD